MHRGCFVPHSEQSLLHAVSRKALDIDGVARSQSISWLKVAVASLADMFTLTVDELAQLERMGKSRPQIW